MFSDFKEEKLTKHSKWLILSEGRYFEVTVSDLTPKEDYIKMRVSYNGKSKNTWTARETFLEKIVAYFGNTSD